MNHDGETDDAFRQRVIALELSDARTRAARADRSIWLSQHDVHVGMFAERQETWAVMREARISYVEGNNIATLVLALAYVEHVLNDALPPLPAGKRSPTMTAAIKQARAAGLFPDDLLDGVAVLSDFRNSFMHRRDQGDPDTLGSRVNSRRTHPTTIGERDAKDALIVMYGFFRHSFDP